MAEDDTLQPISIGAAPQLPQEERGYLLHSSAFSTARYEKSPLPESESLLFRCSVIVVFFFS